MLRRYHFTFIQTLAFAWLALIIVVAITAPLIVPFNPIAQNLELQTAAPGTEGHVLGTDDLGRDVLSRIMYGTRSALIVGTVTVIVSVLLGTTVGILAGWGYAWLDELLMLFSDSLLSIPTVLLAIGIVSFMGYGLVQVMLALGIVFSPVFARLARAETLVVKNESYVEASRALGSSAVKIIRLHILPNILGPVITQAAMTFAMAIVIESSLSYLGLGTQPPNASWGLMLRDGRNYLMQAPWLSLAPGITITLTVLSCNVLGDYASEKIDPKQR